MLRIKSFNEILLSMASWVADNSHRLIDFTEGSIIRMLLESVATELEEYYFKTYQNIIYAMDNSVYNAFGFEKRQAIHSRGNILITLANTSTQEMIIPTGTVFTTGSNLQDTLYFISTHDYIVPLGTDRFQIEVMCTIGGKVGNVPPDTIVSMQNPMIGVQSITNTDAFITGKEEETTAERRARFMKYIESRTRGTKTAIEYGTLEVEGVAGCYVNDVAGAVYVYCHDAYGYLSSELEADVRENLEEYRCAGIPLYIYAPVRTNLSLGMTVHVDPSFNTEDLKDELTLLVENYLNSYILGEDVVLSDVNSLIRDYDPIIIKNCRINTSNDIEVEKNEIIRAGTIEITLMDYED